MANWLTKILPRWSVKAATEGEYRPGPYLIDEGWLSAKAGKFMNWWQMGFDPQPFGQGGAMVEACVSAYSQTVAMCPGDHWRSKAGGGREKVDTSALYRILRKPNDYQSISDFLLNVTRCLYSQGEAFGLAIRNDRGEIKELHWMRNGYPIVAADGSIFYCLSGNEIVDARFDLSLPIPARDVLHVRLHTPRNPLKGESPITASALDRAMAGAALNQQVIYYLNASRPSYMLETDQQLTPEQTKQLRDRWNEQTTGENAGGTPILAWGLKAKPAASVTAQDGQLAELLKMTEQNVALAFRVPMQILGMGGTPFASTEALMSSWKSQGLGFALNHMEEAFGHLFSLKGYPEEYLELDTNALLRSSFAERIKALSDGTRRVYTINEARALEDLAPVPGGNEIRVQQQDVPLSYGEKLQPPNLTQPAPSPANDDDEPDDQEDEDEAKRLSAIFRANHASASANTA